VPLDIFHVAAQQEVLFGAAALEQFNVELVCHPQRGLRVVRHSAVVRLDGRADQIDRADDDDAEKPARPDRDDLVGEENP
jgi:hypothetical protein